MQFGVPPNRIDLITSISGVPTFEEAWQDRMEQRVRDRVVPFLGRRTLRINKQASGRPKDLADLAALHDT